MPNLAQAIEENQFLTVFSDFMSTYQQLAAMKMQQIRDSIMQTRRYMDGLADVFVDVEIAHKNAIKRLKTESEQVVQISLSSLKKNNKHALVLISPDTKFSGTINLAVYEEFKTNYDQLPQAEIFIVGALGETFFKQNYPNKKYQSFHIPQALNKIADIKKLIEVLIEYERTDVFYPRFFTLVKQNAVVTNITGDISLSKQSEQEARLEKDFLFEPSLDKMLRFFELQIFTSLLQQTVNESYLANLGSRIVTLESATQNVNKERELLAKEIRQVNKRIKSKRQHSQIAGIALWN